MKNYLLKKAEMIGVLDYFCKQTDNAEDSLDFIHYMMHNNDLDSIIQELIAYYANMNDYSNYEVNDESDIQQMSERLLFQNRIYKYIINYFNFEEFAEILLSWQIKKNYQTDYRKITNSFKDMLEEFDSFNNDFYGLFSHIINNPQYIVYSEEVIKSCLLELKKELKARVLKNDEILRKADKYISDEINDDYIINEDMISLFKVKKLLLDLLYIEKIRKNGYTINGYLTNSEISFIESKIKDDYKLFLKSGVKK